MTPPSIVQPPTSRQHEVHEYIKAYIVEHGVSPSWEDLRQRFRIPNLNAVKKLLYAMSRKRLIARDATVDRSIKVLDFAPPPATLLPPNFMILDSLRWAMECSSDPASHIIHWLLDHWLDLEEGVRKSIVHEVNIHVEDSYSKRVELGYATGKRWKELRDLWHFEVPE